ncbi:peroxiredoxin family protein [Flammeovirga aprica]|uniref:TlpA family protein disulfide reductase n=1 Tax=Flammeovirga aprica JL-4 TaxID=694437 RepID=A0A7X9P0Y8_9BACT|nr:TlpA disulfide reductase family protein [Flammeovirga aprica]NME66644.1 TlpA family protein disulfide reductase [Flammeovirga aprica JL-4]
MIYRNILFFLIAITGILFSCEPEQNKTSQTEKDITKWRATITNTHQKEVPFYLTVEGSGDQQVWTVINGEERMVLNEVFYEGDSLHIPLLMYEAELVVKEGQDMMNGQFVRKEAYRLPFVAKKGGDRRFPKGEKPTVNFTGNYAVKLGKTDAIGLFNQHEDYLTGTFLTSTGDYRFLEGNVSGNKMYLSSFDGVHILRFEAELEGEKIVNGKMWSGKSRVEDWKGINDPRAELPDPKALTYLKKGFDKFTFSFNNKEGEMVSLEDSVYKDKVVIVQIMGSWCPNCLDEANFFVPLYEKYKPKGLEIVGLSFERAAESEKAYKRINRMKEKLNIDYEVLYAGTPKQTAQALPMLNKVMSFPTSIVLERNGEVAQIHTGFSGPSTGHYYDDYVKEFTALIDSLIKE